MLKPVLIVPQLDLRDRDPKIIDNIVGSRRPTARSSNIDWSNCPLAKRYPDWEAFHEALAGERARQKAGGALAHRAALPPPRGMNKLPPPGRGPWEDGPSAADVRREYPSIKQ